VQEQITTGETPMATTEAEHWLNEHGFSFTLNNQLPQSISILAPFLIAPISSALKLS
jgi:N-acetylglutamate synthase-like GNAT family acetyltransferase